MQFVTHKVGVLGLKMAPDGFFLSPGANPSPASEDPGGEAQFTCPVLDQVVLPCRWAVTAAHVQPDSDVVLDRFSAAFGITGR